MVVAEASEVVVAVAAGVVSEIVEVVVALEAAVVSETVEVGGVVEAAVAVLVAVVAEEASETELESRSNPMSVSRVSTSAEAKMMCSLPGTSPQVRASTTRNVSPLRYVIRLTHLNTGC